MNARFPHSIFGRAAMVCLTTMLACVAGCGSGAGSENYDDGFYTDGRGNKTITRTLDNRTRFYVDVELRVNGVDYLDTIRIRPDDYVNITVEKMRVEDYIRYDARLENGDGTSGEFAEDGLTVFTHDDSRSAGIVSRHTNGKEAIRPGGTIVRFNATVKRASPPAPH